MLKDRTLSLRKKGKNAHSLSLLINNELNVPGCAIRKVGEKSKRHTNCEERRKLSLSAYHISISKIYLYFNL